MLIYVRNEMGLDLMSYILVLLRFWICSLIILAREKIYIKNNWFRFFQFIVLILIISLYLTFRSLNVFIFYIFFEVSLIPTLILIMGWGYQPERLQAGIYLFFYTLLASLPIMISLFVCYNVFGSLRFIFLGELNRFVFYILVNIVFFIKIPMFFVHLWLPKAHVEAPISGSIILAGIILKLGGYGIIRLIRIFIIIGVKINFLILRLRLIGGFLVSLICIRQRDLKSLIAYSSVSHIGLVLSGILTLSYWGITGSLIMIVAHGLCSSGLFCLANIRYERINRRRIYLNKGIIRIIPSLRLVWFLFCSRNIAAPPSLNLLGEVILINRIVMYRRITMIFLILISFFRAVYSLYLFSFTQHGKMNRRVFGFEIRSVREYLLLFLHWIPLNFIILCRDYLVLWVYLISLKKILICGVKDACFCIK